MSLFKYVMNASPLMPKWSDRKSEPHSSNSSGISCISFRFPGYPNIPAILGFIWMKICVILTNLGQAMLFDAFTQGISLVRRPEHSQSSIAAQF